jgi:hypothetical protein
MPFKIADFQLFVSLALIGNPCPACILSDLLLSSFWVVLPSTQVPSISLCYLHWFFSVQNQTKNHENIFCSTFFIFMNYFLVISSLCTYVVQATKYDSTKTILRLKAKYCILIKDSLKFHKLFFQDFPSIICR